MKNISKIVPDPVRVDVQGERLEIAPIKVRELPALVSTLGPLLPLLGELGDCLDDAPGKKDDASGKKEKVKGLVMELLASHADKAGNLVSAVGICLRKDRAWVDELDLDDLAMLVGKVLEVNADFFAQRLLPALTRAIDGVTGAIGGPQSMGSLEQDINSETYLK